MNNEFIKLYQKEKDLIIYWSKKNSLNKETKYFLNFIKRNRRKIINSFNDTIFEISEKKIKNKSLRLNTKIMQEYYLWDYSTLNEKCIYSNPEYLNLLKIIGLISFLKNKKIIKVEINISDKSTYLTLQRYFVQKNIVTILKQEDKKYHYRSILPEIIKTFFLVHVYVLKNFKFFLEKKNIINSKNIFFSYFTIPQKIDQNINNFWGKLTKIFSKFDYKFNFIHLQNVNLNNTKLSSDRYIFLKNYLSFIDIFKAIIIYLIFYFKNYFLLSKKVYFSNKLNLDLQFFFKRGFKKSFYGFKCLETIINILNIKNFINCSSIKNIIYVAENQSWEKILNLEAKKNRIKTFGVIHSLINKWDMRFTNFNNKKNYVDTFPSYFLVNGKYNKNKLAENKIVKKVIEVEALRYSFMKSNKKEKILHKLIIFGSFEELTTKKMLDEINKSNKIKNKYKIYFKNHPSLKSNLKYKYKFLKSEKNIRGCIAIVPNNSSVIIDLTIKKIPALTFDDQYDLNANYYEILSNNNSFSNYKDLENLLSKKSNKYSAASGFRNNSELNLNSKLNLWKKFKIKYL